MTEEATPPWNDNMPPKGAPIDTEEQEAERLDIENRGLDVMMDWICQEEQRELQKAVKAKKKHKCFFLTLQDFKRNMNDFDKMVKFTSNIQYIFKDLLYVIESGKHKDNPNLHVHLIGNYINHKKGKQKVCLEYFKIFGDKLNQKDYWELKQWNNSKEMPPYEQWIQEKVDYILDNDKKGSHSNFIDLSTRPGAKGARGAFTSFIKSPL